MKIKSYLALATFAICASAITLTACSDDDPIPQQDETPTPDKPQKPDENPDPVIPDEPLTMAEKLHAIYDHASIDPQEVTTVHQLAILTSVCASRDGYGPISVTNALLNNEEITLITLGGTQEVEGQATTIKESQMASFGLPNDYLTAVTRLFEEGKIPSHKPVFVTGISLGGMIAQQLLGIQEILSKFEIRAVVTFGSPITLPLDRHGVKVVRFADIHDKVPELGEMMLRTGIVTDGLSKEELVSVLEQLDKTEKITGISKYTEMAETHALSYIEDPCWDMTDFLGDPNKKNVLVLKETMKFYPAPKINKE